MPFNNIAELAQFFEDANCGALFGNFLRTFLEEQPSVELDCRHATLRPATTTPCYGQGVVDNNKAMGIRKDTVWNAAFNFLNVDRKATPTSTKMRVHQLALFSKYDTATDVKDIIAACPTRAAVLHLCGCGICRNNTACTNADHLILGDQGQNVMQNGVHNLLCHATTEDYYTVLNVVRRMPQPHANMF